MSLYIIGDVHGCFRELVDLLEIISFDERKDKILFTGDIVNRGLYSINVLEFVYELNKKGVADMVLGNHDICLLSLYYDMNRLCEFPMLQQVFETKRSYMLIHWLSQRPFMIHLEGYGVVVSHAGIYPLWNLRKAKYFSQYLSNIILDHRTATEFYSIYNSKNGFIDTNISYRRNDYNLASFIMNCFTRMRYCTYNGVLNMYMSKSREEKIDEYYQWFKLVDRRNIEWNKLVFGHWAALGGITNIEDIICIDGGCVHGGSLMAIRLDDMKIYHVR